MTRIRDQSGKEQFFLHSILLDLGGLESTIACGKRYAFDIPIYFIEL